jgi:glycosyltransferase involved in cell wall biosynthesis
MIIKEDVVSIAKAIDHLLVDPEKRSAMGAAGRAWVESTFGGDAVSDRYVDLYRKAINQ